jgi:hypothetical protein
MGSSSWSCATPRSRSSDGPGAVPAASGPRATATPGWYSLPQAENGQECLVNPPLLFGSDPAYQMTEPASIDRAHLLDKDPCRLAEYIDLRPERGGSGTARGRRYEYHGPGQELIGLDHDAKSPPLLLVTLTAGHAQVMDITPEHAGSP